MFPCYTYCNHIAGSTYRSNLSTLCVLQNKIVCIISHAKPRQSAQPVYHHRGIMPLLHINKYVIGRCMYRYCTARVPDILSDFFKKNSEIYEYETRSAYLFHIEEWSKFRNQWGHICEMVEKLVHNNRLSVAVWFWFVPCSINVLRYQLML